MTRSLPLFCAVLLAAAGCSKSSSEIASTSSHAAHRHAGTSTEHADSVKSVIEPEMEYGGAASSESEADALDLDAKVTAASFEASVPAAPPADASPEAVVTAFLEATRRGDDRLASNLLSQKALEETTKMGLAVKPPGTPTMEYKIEQVEFPEGVPDGAYVHSRWSERFVEGSDPYQVTWVLRKHPVGWRIVGMAAEISENDPPYFLNFEQPQDLYRRIQEATGHEPTAPQPPPAE